MIPVPNPIPEPPDFDAACRQTGLRWLAGKKDLPDRPKDFWSRFRLDLRRGFGNRCGYYAMYLHDGQIDHATSWKTGVARGTPELAYEWNNFRFLDGALNSRKGTLDDLLLDPFEIQDGWFEVELPTLFLRIASVPPDRRDAAQRTLERLELDQGPRALELRWEWYDLHRQGMASLDLLFRMAPLVADAIQRWNAAHRGALPDIPRPVSDPSAGLA
jgi:hypothetical protein